MRRGWAGRGFRGGLSGKERVRRRRAKALQGRRRDAAPKVAVDARLQAGAVEVRRRRC